MHADGLWGLLLGACGWHADGLWGLLLGACGWHADGLPHSHADGLPHCMQVGEIYKNAVATEVSKGSALELSATSRLQPHQDDTEKAAFQHMLQRHVDLHLLARAPTMAPLAPKKWLRQNKVHAIDMDAHASAHDGAPPLSPQVHAIDMDGDGKISAAELKAAKAATKAGMEVMAKILPHELPALYDDFTSEVRDSPHPSPSLCLVLTWAFTSPRSPPPPPPYPNTPPPSPSPSPNTLPTPPPLPPPSQLDLETYVECRVRPLANTIERRAPSISRRQQIAEIGSLLANTTGAVLGVHRALQIPSQGSLRVSAARMQVPTTAHHPSPTGDRARQLDPCESRLRACKCPPRRTIPLPQVIAGHFKMRLACKCSRRRTIPLPQVIALGNWIPVSIAVASVLLALQVIALDCTRLHSIALDCIRLHSIALGCT